ncbi:MAG TPA: nucleotidyltransferase family protein [Thermoanaerobaculia bacterium]|nr:nucleotidyltransferase family protein [Thermoanaerobaculia bacterium]
MSVGEDRDGADREGRDTTGAPRDSAQGARPAPRGPVVAIVPAAGASRRMGRAKLLLPFGDTTLVGALADALHQGGAEAIVVVTAPGDAALRAWSAEAGLVSAINPRPEQGMLSSVRAGIAALGGAAELGRRGATLLVTPADLPALRGETVTELLQRLAASPWARLAVPVYRGRRGHPLAIAALLLDEIDALDPRRGLRHLLDRHLGDLLEVVVEDPGAVADVDTPGDYESLRPRAC